MSDAAVCRLAASCTSLCQVSLHKCEKVGDDAVIALATHCQRTLVNLGLMGCFLVSDKGLQTLAACPALEDLDARELPLLTDRSIDAIISRCTKLQRLCIQGSDGLSDRLSDLDICWG
jgi:hypothetical protein